MKKWFSEEPCNTGRQFELDVFRFILIYRLAIVHVFVEGSPPGALDVLGIPYYFDSIVGGLIGPTRFMIVMGIGLTFTRHGTPKEVFCRGVKIGIIGLVLNVFRYLVPSLIGFAVSGDADKYLNPLPYLFFGSDILQFASLAMMFMALLLWLKLTFGKIMAVSLAMSIAGTFLRNVDFHNNVLNVIMGHFVGVETVSGEPFIYSDYPLLIWFLFYAFGFLFGYYYQRLKDKKKFYNIVSPICIVITVLFCIWEIRGKFGMMMGEGVNVFYHMTTPEALICIIAFVGSLVFSFYLSKIIPERFKKPIESVSRNVNQIYCIHWVLVWWVVNLLLFNVRKTPYLRPVPAFFLGLGLSVLSMLIAEVWTRFKNNVKRKRVYEKEGQYRKTNPD